MTVKFYLKEPKKKKSLIVARILWGNYQLPYSTKQSIETAFWIDRNKEGQRIQRVKQTTAYPNNSGYNQALDNLENNITKVFLRFTNDNYNQQPSPALLKKLLDTYLNRGNGRVALEKIPTFMEYFENFITRSERGVRINRKTGQSLSKDTIKTYNTLFGHLKEYNKKLDWPEINTAFHADYTEYLMETFDLSNSSIGKDISIIKVVCSEAYYEKINKFDDYTNPLFNVSRETSDSIHLTNEEINILYNLNLSHNKNLEVTRDLFVLGCLTGLRYSDYSRINNSQISGFKLHVKTVKGNKKLEVNVRDSKAQSIIKKYINHFPQGAVNQVFNRNLKEICKDIPQFQGIVERSYTKGGKRITENKPKYDMVKSHSGRRSFCTNEVEAGTPIAVIMNNSGHSSEKSFWRYVKLNKSHYYDMYDAILKDRHQVLKVV